MTEAGLDLLDGFLADPTDPCWSSAAMDRMFAGVEGTSKQKLLTVLERTDDRFAASSSLLTEVQTEFIRQVTLFAYTYRIASDLNSADLDWLLTHFRSTPTPQRALMITLLIAVDELPPDINLAILNELRGTPGQRYLDPNVVRDFEKT